MLIITFATCGYTKCIESYQQWQSPAIRDIPQAYMTVLSKNPLMIKAWTSGILFGISDAAAQLISEKQLGWLRVFWFACWGLLGAAPMMHVWYDLLEKSFAPQNWSSSLAMVLVDQSVFTPMYTLMYFVYDGLTKGNGFAKGIYRFGEQGKKVVLSTWCFWYPANLFNFTYIPLELRVLYVSTLAILWNAYFSFLTQRKSSSIAVASPSEPSQIANSKAMV